MPLHEIPTELRLTIYELAFHNALQNFPFATRYLPGRRALSGHQLHSLLEGVLAVLHTSRSLRVESITVYRRSASALLESRELRYEQLNRILKRLPLSDKYLLMSELSAERRALVTEIRHVCALLQEVQMGQTDRGCFERKARIHRSGMMLCWPGMRRARQADDLTGTEA